jgi:hypothetical protein
LKVRPAIVRVPLRVAPVLLLAPEYVTEPFPMPLLAEVTVSQLVLLTAFQTHSEPAVMVTVPVPPAAATELAAGAIVLSQAEGATPDWKTVKVLCATVRVPIRKCPVKFSLIS